MQMDGPQHSKITSVADLSRGLVRENVRILLIFFFFFFSICLHIENLIPNRIERFANHGGALLFAGVNHFHKGIRQAYDQSILENKEIDSFICQIEPFASAAAS
jgi:hypothetical protein